MLSKIGSFAFKKETTPGTAETITASEAIYIKDGKLKIVSHPQARNVLRNVTPDLVPIRGSEEVELTGTFEMKGSGTPGTPNTILGDILESLALAEVADSGHRVTYTGVADPSVSSVGSGTAKGNVGGKYLTGLGLRGDGSFKFKAGELLGLDYSGKGGLVATGDENPLADPSDFPKPLLTIGAMYLLEHHSDNVYALPSGSDYEGLRMATGVGEELAVTINQAAAFKPKYLVVITQKVGTPAGETLGFWAEIQADSTGDPSGTAITNGTTAKILTTLISTTKQYTILEFATPPTCAGTTPYHVVLKGDWTGSDTNYIKIGTIACAVGAQQSQKKSTTYAAISLENVGCILVGASEPEMIFGDVELKLGNNVDNPPNYNHGGYYLAKILGQNPEITMSPLEVLDATRNLRAYQGSGTDLFWLARVGATAGNKITFLALHCRVSDDGGQDNGGAEVTHPLTVRVENPTDLSIIFE